MCREHEHALLLEIVKYHLRRLHAFKNQRLRAILEKIRTSSFLFSSFDDILRSSNQISTVSRLIVYSVYQCAVTSCNREEQALSRELRTIQKHLTRQHDIERNRFTQLTFYMIREISVQFFFSSPRTHYFVVRSTQLSRSSFRVSVHFIDIEFTLHASSHRSNTLTQSLQAAYETSQHD